MWKRSIIGDVHFIIKGYKDENSQSAKISICNAFLLTAITYIKLLYDQIFSHHYCCIIFFFLFLCTVICNFRSSICQALVLEIGETVQILEKSEGNSSQTFYGNVYLRETEAEIFCLTVNNCDRSVWQGDIKQ